MFTADRGMLSASNLAALDSHDIDYAVAAKLKALPTALAQEVLKIERRSGAILTLEHCGRRLVVGSSSSRAFHDRQVREAVVAKIKQEIAVGKDVRTTLSKRGRNRYLTVNGEATVQVDQDKVNADAVWDGLYGAITNVQHLTPSEVLERYRQQWRIEECFRIHTHNLDMRPICFIAYSLMRHREKQLMIQLRQSIGMTEVREALGLVDFSIIRHVPTGRRVNLPGAISAAAAAIYQAMGLKWSKEIFAM